MKKIILVASILAMIMTLSSCGNNVTSEENFNEISNAALNESFVKACIEIDLDVSEIEDFTQVDDWAGGPRYNFTYLRHPVTLYANGNNTVNSINLDDTKIYLAGWEPYSINDFIVDMDIAEELIIDAESVVKSNLNYPSSADFSLLNWSYGRERYYYQLSSSVEAENGFGVESDIPFSIIYKVSDGSYKVVALNIDGSWVINGNIPKYDSGRKELKTSSSNKEITLIDGTEGEYGNFTKVGSEEYVWYYIPEGTYEVISNVDWCMVFVDKDKTFTNSDGYIEVVNVETYEFTTANQKQLVTLASGQHIALTVNASVTFVKK